MPLDTLGQPFKLVAKLLLQNQQQLVPFARGALRAQFAQQAKDKGPPHAPSLNLTVPGLPQILQLIPGAGSFFGDIDKILKDLVTANLPGLLGDTARLIPDGISFVGQQLGLGLSLIALLGEAAGGKDHIASAVNTSYQEYFFGDGYQTLDGGLISPPTLDSASELKNPSLSQIVAELRKQVSRKTGDQYVRDLVRITGEAVGDAIFHLSGRYQRLIGRVDQVGRQEQSWFKGFSNLAESTVMSAVEEAAQGVAAFSTNPLIAASLGTFAGVAARKATQDAVLWECGIEAPAS